MWNSWGTESASGHALLPSSSASSSSSSSHHHQVGRWFEVGEEASLKKRRCSSTEGVDVEETVIMMKEKKGNMRKKKSSKKNFNEDENYEEQEREEEEEEEKDGTDDGDLVKKKGSGSSSNSSTGGGSVMEGSGCSRVNGRGWRCCQQTLVGYALCEHHLGKGRLRSMISVRSRSSSTEPPKSDNFTSNDYSGDDGSLSPSSCKQWEDGDEEEEEEEKLMTMKEKSKNKRRRIGIVKARSISSLLGQTQHTASTTAPTTAMALGSNLSNKNNNNLA